MTKSMFHTTLAVVACLAVAISSAEAKGLKNKNAPTPRREALGAKDRVQLEIAGPTDSAAAEAYTKAFQANGLQATVHETKKGGKPLRVMAQVDKSSDLSPWSKAVATAMPTKKGQQPPAVELIVYAPITKENASQVTSQLEKVKGVDAKYSTVDSKKGAVRVRISGADRVTAEDVSNALQSAGVTASFEKSAKTAKTPKTKT